MKMEWHPAKVIDTFIGLKGGNSQGFLFVLILLYGIYCPPFSLEVKADTELHYYHFPRSRPHCIQLFLFPQYVSQWVFSSESNHLTTLALCQQKDLFLSVLLNLWENSKIPEHRQQIIALLLVLAKSKVASKWKTLKQPSIQSWYDRILHCFMMSKITDSFTRN